MTYTGSRIFDGHNAMASARYILRLIIIVVIALWCTESFAQGPGPGGDSTTSSMQDPKVAAAIVAAITACVVALVGALVSAISAIWSYYTTRKNQHDLESMRSQLAEERAERDARRDYEYEARKRLYEEYEPLLFQLVELSENANHRVYSLARTAREGDLTETDGGWLSQPNYYMVSTIYTLLAPMVMFKLMQRRLTLVDLHVDPRIAAQYTLAKILYLTITCDHEMAKVEPGIEYKPNVDGWVELRQMDPRKHWRQGLALGRIDNALDDLLVVENGTARLRSFGEYHTLIEQEPEDNRQNSYRLTDILCDFHPNTRPILWRLLIAQAHVHRLIIGRIGNKSLDPLKDLKQQLVIPENERAPFDWRSADSTIPVDAVLKEPFDAATKFVKSYLEELMRYAELPSEPAA